MRYLVRLIIVITLVFAYQIPSGAQCPPACPSGCGVPPDPPCDPGAPAPITGIEILVGIGVLVGIVQLNRKRVLKNFL